MTVVIDRFEGDLAVLVDAHGATADIPRAWLPDTAREGDAVALDTRPVDLADAHARLARLKASDPGGDLDL